MNNPVTITLPRPMTRAFLRLLESYLDEWRYNHVVGSTADYVEERLAETKAQRVRLRMNTQDWRFINDQILPNFIGDFDESHAKSLMQQIENSLSAQSRETSPESKSITGGNNMGMFATIEGIKARSMGIREITVRYLDEQDTQQVLIGDALVRQIPNELFNEIVQGNGIYVIDVLNPKAPVTIMNSIREATDAEYKAVAFMYFGKAVKKMNSYQRNLETIARTNPIRGDMKSAQYDELRRSVTNPQTITLTLPTPAGGGISHERAKGVIHIQRDGISHAHQFHYLGFLQSITDAIRDAVDALNKVTPSEEDEGEKAPAVNIGLFRIMWWGRNDEGKPDWEEQGITYLMLEDARWMAQDIADMNLCHVQIVNLYGELVESFLPSEGE